FRRRGSVLPLVTVGLLAILGLTALALDVTRLHIAAQRAQAVADSAALAGVTALPQYADAKHLALEAVDVNNTEVPEWQAYVSPGEAITYYAPGSTILGREGEVVMQLGSYTAGIGVEARVGVDYAFAPVLGLQEGSRTRRAVAIQGPAGAIAAVPIWISEDSNPGYGDPVDLVYDDVKEDGAIPPGSFGFIDFAVPNHDWFGQLLRGYNIADAVHDEAWIHVDDIITAYTGVNTGKWVHALQQETEEYAGTARLERAAQAPWAEETFDVHSTRNPHIMLVPVVQHLYGTGTGATFKVVSFAVFWLDGVGKMAGGSNHCLQARFIEFQPSPEAVLDPEGPDTGIYVRKLIL
ncbi:MAG: Tad domain-containing protein, partial [Armatimonadota bacterium]